MANHNPCQGGPLQSVYRCNQCDGRDDIISLGPIAAGDGVCVDRQCYDRHQLTAALQHNQRVPHNRRH